MCLGSSEILLATLLEKKSAKKLTELGRQRNAIADFLWFMAAVCVGFCALVAVLLRFSGGRAAILRQCDGQTLFAVHGEWSNRTRHLLSRLDGGMINPVAIIILGRLRISLAEVVFRWRKEIRYPLPPVVIPQSWRAFFSALPSMFFELPSAYRQLRTMPLRPPLYAHGALAFRVMLGSVQSHWWRANGVRESTIFLGHTGLGDTTRLERQMQYQGCETVHVVHGISTGPNFVGFSSKALFHCAADAEQYASLYHYGSCLAPVAPLPSWCRGKSGLLLFTNLAHPMNLGYLKRGIEDELRVLHLVAQISRQLGSATLPMRWKPHPALASLPASERTRVRERAFELGFEECQEQSSWLLDAESVRWVITTPSTIAIDLLRAGCLPVLVNIQDTEGDGVSGYLPLKIHNESQGVKALREADLKDSYRMLQEQAWRNIRPTHDSALDQLASFKNI
jgi:hypothetical protein